MLVHEPTQSLVMKVPDPDDFQGRFRHARVIQHPDYNLQLKHTLATVERLSALGYNPPSPIEYRYRWPGKYKPFAHQRKMASFLTVHRRAFNLSEMGVGKSAAALWAADYLLSEGAVKKVLILSPLSTLRRVWQSDIFDVLLHRTALVAHGTREQRLDAIQSDVDFVIMNHEGVTIEPVNHAIRTDKDIQLVIVDESSMFRNSQTKKYKSLVKMLRPDMRLWLLSGTPCPNSPTDAWAQAKLINPAGVPKFFGAFRRQTMKQVTQFKWVPHSDAYDIVYKAMQPAIRFKKKDCLDLPPMVIEDREVKLSAEQKKHFEAMRKQMQIEAKENKVIKAVNAADRINKLRQICGGVIREPDTGNYVPIDHAPRTAELLDTLAEADAKCIVVVPFKGIIYDLQTELSKHYSVGMINGDVSAKARDNIILQFKTQRDPHVLLAHPAVMSHGLNLTEADMLVFYSPIYSNDQFQQVIERFNRTGQTRKMTVVRLGGHPLEWSIYDMVDKRRTTQDNILDLYKQVIS